MTREHDSEAGRLEIEKLRRDNAIMNEAIETASRQLLTSENWRITFRLLRDASDACDAPLDAIGKPTDDNGAVFESERLERESHHTPLVFPKVTDAEMDAIAAGPDAETHGRTEATS